MQVFKLYFKLLKNTLPSILIYIGVFLAVVISYSLYSRQTSEKSFEESKVKIAFINRDEDSVLLDGFKKYLGDSCVFVDIKDSKDAMQDALFFREVVYIAIIPEGFTKQFLEGEEVIIDKLIVPDSTDSTYIDLSINNYLNTAKLYQEHSAGISQQDLVDKVATDLKSNVKVDIYSKDVKEKDNSFLINYYNYLVYAILSTLILGISSIMISFTNLDIRRRNLVTPVSITSINIQQILGNLTFTFALDLLLIFVGFILNEEVSFSKINLLFILNAVIFSIAALSIAYLVGILIKSREASNGIANIIGMGSCFISGVFVPKEFLGDSVLNIAKFLPTYWYTSANEMIGNLTNFTFANLTSIYQNILIQFGFAVALFAVALVVSKRKSLDVI